MTADWIGELRDNALNGDGLCATCPAFEDGGSCRGNPGLFDPDGDVMFVTTEPSHRFDWADYESWDIYNRVISRKFVEEWTGGANLEELLEPIQGGDIGSVWMADAIKCPPEGGIDDQTRDDEFAHCETYLCAEIEQVDPDVIVGLGKNTCSRTLSALRVDRKRISTVQGVWPCLRYKSTPDNFPHGSYGWLSRGTSNS